MASDAAASGSAGSITAAGTLNVTTTNALTAAVGLQGNGASILATGGGAIASAGDAIAFLGGTGQTATFDNFTIGNQTGDLVFADPSVATVNFNNTTADAGTNDLIDATAGSVVTLNANASTLIGAIQTGAGSMTTVNLTNGSTWTMTGSSVVSNLAVANSVVVFAPPSTGGGFKTLTVGNYLGSGANLSMNAVLGGAGSPSDQIIINGGKATGSTLITINNVGGLGGQTIGPGIPLVVAVNGGTIASNAFALANTPASAATNTRSKSPTRIGFSSPRRLRRRPKSRTRSLMSRRPNSSRSSPAARSARSSSARPNRSTARIAARPSARSAHTRSAPLADGASPTN